MEISRYIKFIRIALGFLTILGIIFVSYVNSTKNNKIENQLTAIYEKELDFVEGISSTGSKNTFTVDLILKKKINEKEKKNVTGALKYVTCNILAGNQYSEISTININLREYDTADHIYSRIINKDKCI